MNSPLTVTLIIAFLLSVALSQTCNNAPDPSTDLLTTGNLQLINPFTATSSSSQLTRYHQLTINVPFTASSYKIAASLSGFSFTSSFNNSLDFSIISGRKSNSVAQINVFINQDASWTSVTISYILTSRTDIFVGTFYTEAFIKNQQTNQIVLYHDIPNWTPLSGSIQNSIYLSGMRCNSTSLSFSILSSTFNPNGSIIVTLDSRNTPSFELIQFVYVWWNTAATFTWTTASNAAYLFSGISSFSSRSFGFASRGLNRVNAIPCIGTGCPSACVISCSNGVLQNNQCFRCGSGQQYQNGLCSNTVNCGVNQFYNGTSCVCQSGFFVYNGACVASCGVNAYVTASRACLCVTATNCFRYPVCPINQVLINNQCQCAMGFASIGNNCVSVVTCPTGYIWSSSTMSCICNSSSCISCPANSYWSGSACVCNNGYSLVNSVCVLQPVCPQGASLINGVCTCTTSGFFVINGVCGACPSNSNWNGTNCVCVTNYYQLSNGSCITCPANFTFTNDRCVCSSGTYSSNGVCVSCPSGTVWNGNTCACPVNSILVNGACSQCPVNTVSSGNTCVCAQGFNLINNVCTQCPSNSYFSGSGCVCNLGYYFSNGACLLNNCPANSTWNGNACICNQGLNLVNGACIACQANSVYNGNACVCIQGFNLIGGVCAQCPVNSTWNGNSCICNQGFVLVNSRCVQCPANSTYNGNACICNAGLNLINNQCLSCPLFSTYNGSACVCNQGYNLVNNQCIQCPTNSVFNGAACVCNNNLFLINGACTTCPTNSVYNGSACVCGAGFSLINGQCSQCPANSVFNGTACVCSTGFSLVNSQCIQCPSNSAYNGSACVCSSGFYPSGNNCLSCGPNASYNGTACVCNSGFNLINNVCGQCPTGSTYNLASQSCVCGAGFYVSGSSCLACSPSCATCSASGALFCLTCPAGYGLSNGQCLPTSNVCLSGTYRTLSGICLPCPSTCLTCSDAYTCISCKTNYTLNTQIINQVTNITCVLIGPETPGVRMSLTGAIVGNGVVYQGVILSQLPTQLLLNNCANCSDLLTVNVYSIGNITTQVQFVLYSQFWFIISFKYTSAIVPTFQYTVQLNYNYANYFTSADYAQKLYNQANPVTYPTQGGTVNNNGTTTPSKVPDPNKGPIFQANGAPPPRTVVGADGKTTVVSNSDLVALFK